MSRPHAGYGSGGVRGLRSRALALVAGAVALLAIPVAGADGTAGSGPYAVRFSHQAHLARGALPCEPCHGAAAGTKDLARIAPDKDQCTGCHDGKQAFSVIGPHCRRCHVQGAGAPGLRARRGPGFSHGDHQALGLDMACRSCHGLDARGTPLPPAPDHMPCAEAACHRDQFSARAPTICGACHLGTEPWARLHFDRPPQGQTEFGARFSHRLHHGLPVAGDSQSPKDDPRAPRAPRSRDPAGACIACHGTRARNQRMGLPAGHAACAGSACHAAGPAGPVTDAVETTRAAMPLHACERCHVRGLLASRVAARLQQPWSVRARFRHEPHGVDPTRGVAMSCTACHADLSRSQTLADIPGPSKAVCAPCHDGRVSFKLTGHGCARCHGRGTSP